MWDQLQKFDNNFTFKTLTADDLTDALIKICEKTTSSNHDIYVNTDTAEIFWDVLNIKNFINVYGIKQIGKQDGLFVYEGVLFDKFPDNYDSLYISYRNRFNCERAEEIEVLELTDTKIVFKCSVKFPEDKDNIILQWN